MDFCSLNAAENENDRCSVLPWRVYLAIGLCTLLVVATLAHTWHMTHRMIARNNSLGCATMELRLEATRAHLWLGQVLGGDRNADEQHVYRHLDNADWYARAMLEGGQNHRGRYYPLSDGRARSSIQEIRKKLNRFRAMASERFADAANSQTDTRIDEEYDVVFSDVVAASERLEAELKELIGRDSKHFGAIQILLICGCLLSSGLLVLCFRRFMRASRRYQERLKTARKQAEHSEAASRSQREKLEATFRAAPVGMLLIDGDMFVRQVNNVAAKLTGKSVAEIVDRQPGNGLGCIYAENDEGGCGYGEACSQCPIRSVLKGVLGSGNAVRGAEVQVTLMVDGKEVSPWLEVSVEPVDFGETSCLLLALDNITERKEAEERLEKALRHTRQAKEESEELNDRLMEATAQANHMAAEAKWANAAKSQFLANMSHEIRTPVNSVIGFSDLLAEEELTDSQKEYVRAICESGRNLLELINDILDISKIEAGQLNIELVDCSLDRMLNSLETLMKVKACQKGLEFRVVTANDLPAQMRTDPTRLRQCLVNLVGNAVKFTERGHVHVAVRPVEEDGRGSIRFDVADTGIGIATDRQPAIFESFTQADGKTARKYGGTGLGLAITRQLAELLGGRVALKSDLGKGSTFSLTIPVVLDAASLPATNDCGSADEQGDECERTATARTTLRGRILVAEDVPANQMLMTKILEREGLGVSVAADGSEAIDKALSGSYDAILMDMQMPNTNGHDATRALRRRGLTTPIIALTAEAMAGDEKKCIDAGCDDYLSKPIERDKLFETLSRHLSCRDSKRQEQDMQNEPTDASRKTIDSITEQVDQMSRIISDEPVAGIEPGHQQPTCDAECVINFERLISRVVDEDLVEQVMPMCVDDNRKRLEMLTEAVGKNDSDKVKNYAHSIKGSAANMGAMQLSEPAYRLERMASKGDLSQARELLSQIRTEFEKLEAFVATPNWMEIAKGKS